MRYYLTLMILFCILETQDKEIFEPVQRAYYMTTSKTGIDLIKSFESFRENAYQDSAGIWTVGWGTTYLDARPVEQHNFMTEELAGYYFQKDLVKFEGYVKKYVTVPINQNQFDALVSLCYNIGQGNLKISSVIRHLNNYNYDLSGDSFKLWNKARSGITGKLRVLRGLTRRREAEKQLFMLS